METILSANQRLLLDALAREELVTKSFYLTGGTALAEYYLRHRLSEDLDFFCAEEFDPAGVTALFRKIKPQTGIAGVRYEQAFNRNLFFVDIGGETIKTEFTYFPFGRIDPARKEGALQIDSLIDIAVNKLFTIFQKPRSRDFIDLYCILQRERSWTVAELSRQARAKFDTHIDPLQLGAQFLRAEELRDYPRMLVPLAPPEWQAFFVREAKRLKPEVLEE
jgi:predicted nucleotidyltransferase component of viral defense system